MNFHIRDVFLPGDGVPSRNSRATLHVFSSGVTAAPVAHSCEVKK